MSSNSGYFGSLAVHGAIIGIALLLARMTPEHTVDADSQDPLLLEVWTGDGSTRDPGIPGRDRGIAEGAATGNKTKVGLGGMPRLNFSAKSMLDRLHANEAKAAAAAAAAEKEAARQEKADKSDDKHSDKSEKVSIADWKKAHPGQKVPPSTGGKVAVTGGKTAGVSGKSGTSSITGGKVGTGKGSGEDGFGRAGGKHGNGGDGGSGDALRLFRGDVKGKYDDAFQPLFSEQGGDISGSKDDGVVVILVSPSGLVRFLRWNRRPSNPEMERIVLAAIAKMLPVRPPPDGKETELALLVTGKVTE